MTDVSAPPDPDLVKGISLDDVPDDHMLGGHAGNDDGGSDGSRLSSESV